MAEIDERVATLEGRIQEQVTRMTDFRDGMSGVQQSVVDLRGEMGRLGDELRGDMGRLRGELTATRSELRAEIAALREEMDRRFDRMDQKYLWLVGIVVTTGLATMATVAGAFFGLLQAIQQHA